MSHVIQVQPNQKPTELFLKIKKSKWFYFDSF
jgi:hypothetical protein